MEQNFWNERWKEGRTAFHQSDIHPMLRAYAAADLRPDDNVLVPLCGKSLDMLYLVERAARVVGVEFVRQAIEEFLGAQRLEAQERDPGRFVLDKLELLCRDFLALTVDEVGRFDYIYDRAALVALPEELRRAYARKILELCAPDARMLLIAFEYEQSRMEGPPFSITPAMVAEYYGADFVIEECDRQTSDTARFPRMVEHGIQLVTEVAYRLRRR
jgi:thiopurine S-methyltransferase